MHNWTVPLHHPELASDEVHVWRACLDRPDEEVQALERTLTPDERTRAARYRFLKDRMHFTVARGMLRTLLGRYLLQQPSELQFRYNQYGKPLLEEDAPTFNVSHSHGMALFAFTRGREVGVDIEYMLPDRAELSIARRFFSPYEVAALQAVPAAQQTRAFFSCWTRKEAYVKTRGLGLSLDLNLFDVSLAPGTPAALLNIREPGQRLSDWSLWNLEPGDGYAAALAVKGPPCQVVCWEWAASLL
ncbi:MAG: 4'-phosphopantetheinyl transferase superfamily protein [Chloroflexota bacterium]|nr:4'-phosphopantetheinyl transferase superfamily protein [Chloroflexota bacterium]